MHQAIVVIIAKFNFQVVVNMYAIYMTVKTK